MSVFINFAGGMANVKIAFSVFDRLTVPAVEINENGHFYSF